MDALTTMEENLNKIQQAMRECVTEEGHVPVWLREAYNCLLKEEQEHITAIKVFKKLME